MTFLPLIERELRLRARSRTLYVMRLVVGLMGALLCVPQSILTGPQARPSGAGHIIFLGLSGLAFVLSCCACLLAAEAIAGERREGTLGLLFLTNVASSDVLLAKLLAVGAVSLCGVIAFLPVMMIPVLAGGVTGGEVFRKVLALLVTMFLALCVGLRSSAGVLKRFRPAAAALGLMAVLVLVPVMLAAMVPAWLEKLRVISPLGLMKLAGDVAYAGAPGQYWASVGVLSLGAWVLLVDAGRRLRRAVCEESRTLAVNPEKVRAKARQLGFGKWEPAKGQANPLEWLVHRQHGMGAGLWTAAVLACGYSRWVALAHLPTSPAGSPPPGLLAWPMGLAAAFFGGTLLAWVACRFFAGVRRSGDLELLLTTPVGAGTLLSDQWGVLKRFFVWPITALVVGMLLPVIGARDPAHPGPAVGPVVHLLCVALYVLNSVLGVWALCWLGLWSGLKARGLAAALVRTVSLAVSVPWLADLAATLLFTERLARFAGTTAPPILVACCWLPELAIALYLFWLGTWSQRRLQAELGNWSEPADPVARLRAAVANLALPPKPGHLGPA